MRTRIALVAITPIAVITISTLVQAATEQSTGAEPAPISALSAAPGNPILPDQLIAYRGLGTSRPALAETGLLSDVSGALLLHPPSTTVAGAPPKSSAPVPAASSPATAASSTVTASTDTVTPDQRAAWERVAMCEEGGTWTVDGGRFSGGLGITRSNWDAYGGTEYAADGAEATEDQQIMVAERIQSSPPDQYGCGGW